MKIATILGGLFAGAVLGQAQQADAFFQSKTVIIPKDAKLKTGGEDSADTSDAVIAVADGVGGWEELGIDSGLFSRELTRTALDAHKINQALTAD